MALNKQLVGFRLPTTAAAEIERFLPSLRRQTGLNCNFSDLMRHCVQFALKHRDMLVADLKGAK
jgi:hypothetical protein